MVWPNTDDLAIYFPYHLKVCVVQRLVFEDSIQKRGAMKRRKYSTDIKSSRLLEAISRLIDPSLHYTNQIPRPSQATNYCSDCKKSRYNLANSMGHSSAS
jgi:hypothetical protein